MMLSIKKYKGDSPHSAMIKGEISKNWSAVEFILHTPNKLGAACHQQVEVTRLSQQVPHSLSKRSLSAITTAFIRITSCHSLNMA